MGVKENLNVENLKSIFGGFGVEFKDGGNYYISHEQERVMQNFSTQISQPDKLHSDPIVGASGEPKYVKDHYGDGKYGVILTSDNVKSILGKQALAARVCDVDAKTITAGDCGDKTYSPEGRYM